MSKVATKKQLLASIASMQAELQEVIRVRNAHSDDARTARSQVTTLKGDLEKAEQRLKRMEGDAFTNFRLFAAQQARADALELALRLVHKAEKPQDPAAVPPNANTMEPTTSDFYTADVAFGVMGRR